MSVTWRVKKSELRQPFADDVDKLLADDPDEWVVTEGLRDSVYQKALYEKYLKGGPRAAPPGKSAHEKGLAIDVSLIKNNRTIWDPEDPAWQRIIHKVHMHPRLHSLADIGDYDHIEAVNWRIIAAQANA